MDQGGSSSAKLPAATGGGKMKGKKAHRKGPKPKITKEERREKYTAIARGRREANMSRMRDKDLVCYRCRKTGHSAENCKATSDGDGGGGGKSTEPMKKKGGNICYKCGSNEHRIQLCPKIKPFLQKGKTKIDFGKLGDLPYADCYVCNKSGHLAGYCPDSKKGLYPKGGSCRECGSVDHYARDCPGNDKGKSDDKDDDDASNASSVVIDQFLEEPAVEEKVVKKSKKKSKVVNF